MAYLLIVDDDEDFATAASRILRSAGHEISIAPDPDSAVQSMESRLPDLAILDVMFPQDISAGFELARRMQRDHEKLKNVPILMLTAISQKFPLGFGADDIDGDSLPVADFLTKPIDFKVLVNRVSALLAGAGATDGDEET